MTSSTYNNPSAFETLPPEIQCCILEQLPDSKALGALISASPSYFSIYKAFEATILSHVAVNHITPSALPIALDALAQRKPRGKRRDPTAVLAFLKGFRLESTSEPDELPLMTSKELLRFHNTTEYFIADFASGRLATIHNRLPSEIPRLPSEIPYLPHEISRPTLSLSRVEYSRIARAFYIIDLYGNLFSTPKDAVDDITAVEQWTLFLERLRNWELEEFLCIRTYLTEKLTDFLNQVEDDFMQALQEDNLHVIEPCNTTNRWENDDWFFSENGHAQDQELWLRSCLTRGLVKLKAMLTESNYNNRLEAIGNTDCPRHTMTDALASMRSYQDSRQPEKLTKTRCRDTELHDDPEHPSEGWSLAVRRSGHPRSPKNHGDLSYWASYWEDMRRWGYAIWDSDRLQSLGFFSSRSIAVYRVPVSDERDLMKRRNKPSVEQRTRVQEKIWKIEGLIHNGYVDPNHPEKGRWIPGFSLES